MFHNGARVSERLDSIEAMQAHTEAMTTEIRNVLKHLTSSLCGTLPGLTADKTVVSEQKENIKSELAAFSAEIYSEAGNRKRQWRFQKQKQARGIQCQASDSFNSEPEKDSLFCLPKNCKGNGSEADLNVCGISVRPVRNDESMRSLSSVQVRDPPEVQGHQICGHSSVQYKEQSAHSINEVSAGVPTLKSVAASSCGALETASSLQGVSAERMDIPGRHVHLPEDTTEIGLKFPDLSWEGNNSAEDVEHTTAPSDSAFYTGNTWRQPAPGTTNALSASSSNMAPFTQAIIMTECQGTEQNPVQPVDQAELSLLDSDQNHVRLKQHQHFLESAGLPPKQGSMVPNQLMYC
jgi:hypothetical protein